MKRVKSQRNYSKCFPPGPPKWPLIGNLFQLFWYKSTFRWMHLVMKEMNTEIASFHFGSVYVIPITCPRIAQEFLKKQDSNFASRPLSFASHTFSGGYATAVMSPYGDQWKKMRRIMTSRIICPNTHQWLHNKRQVEADNLLFYVFNRCKNLKNVNVRMAARHYCGNVIRKLVFNKRYFGSPLPDGGPGFNEVEHVEALFDSLGYLYAFCISDYFPQLVGLDLDGHEKIVKDINKTLKKYHDPIVEDRLQKWRHENRNKEKELEDLLDVLITLQDDQGKPLLTSREIKAQVTEIMMAAVDNPSNAVEWALAEMMNNPNIMDKAVKELDRVVGKERLVQETDIPQLNYLKACIRESFRLHPIAPFNVPHVALSDTTVDGYFIPKGSHVLLSRIGLGRNPRTWDEPHTFMPERHLNNNTSSEVVLTEPDLKFISFSTGRRGCIAASLGTAMTMMLLARLLQGFTWRKPQNFPNIDLVESRDNLFLARPLVLHAQPRLPLHLYPTYSL
ncbi:hypothetical protein ACFE04_000669 [Oxalis oulophora]